MRFVSKVSHPAVASRDHGPTLGHTVDRWPSAASKGSWPWFNEDICAPAAPVRERPGHPPVLHRVGSFEGCVAPRRSLVYPRLPTFPDGLLASAPAAMAAAACSHLFSSPDSSRWCHGLNGTPRYVRDGVLMRLCQHLVFLPVFTGVYWRRRCGVNGHETGSPAALKLSKRVQNLEAVPSGPRVPGSSEWVETQRKSRAILH